MDWKDRVEHTGEVSILVVAESTGVTVQNIRDFVNNNHERYSAYKGHGSRYVGGTSESLIWREDAEEIERRGHFCGAIIMTAEEARAHFGERGGA